MKWQAGLIALLLVAAFLLGSFGFQKTVYLDREVPGPARVVRVTDSETTLASISAPAVDPDGQIFPCHMFIGNKEYKLGDISSNEPIASFKIPISKNSSCKDCWAASSCVTCLGRVRDYSGDLSQLFSPDCVLKRAVIKKVLDNVDKLECNQRKQDIRTDLCQRGFGWPT